VLIRDIVPGSDSSSPTNIRAINNSLVVFRAQTATHGQEPWVSDGTSAGTFLLADTNPGVAHSVMGVPTVAGGRAYFTATTNGEVELWATNGTVAGTVQYDINPGTQSSSPSWITTFGNDVILAATNLDYGAEPYLAKATGVTLLDDINSVPSSNPSGFVQLGSTLYFAADDGVNGRELWKSDGTLAGTVMVKNINPEDGAASNPALLTVVGSLLYFRADDGTNGAELWRTDGTSAGTVMVANFADEAPAGITQIAAIGSTVYFDANDGVNGIELWKATGPGTATLVKNIYTGTPATSFSGSPTQFAVMGGKLYFRATDANGAELWVSDGTSAGTVLVKNIRPGSSSSSPTALMVVGGNKIFFTANDGTTSTELYVSDGTTANTYRVADLNPGAAASAPANLRDLNGTLLFSALEPVLGRELYKVTGNVPSLTLSLVKDIRTGPANSNPASPLVLGTKMYFSATDAAAGAELWSTDGTAAGTARVADGRAGTAGSNPAGIVSIDANTLFFVANDGVNGSEPWRSNLTATGTYLVQDINTLGPAYGGAVLSINGTVYFSATDGVSGFELWKY
jgi:ELWxxDGT repeat protein